MQPRSILALLAIAAFVMAAGPAAHAVNYTWTGNTSTDWSDEGNWFAFQSGYPHDSGDTATVGNQTNDPVLTEDITVGSVTIQNGGVVTTGANTLEVTGSGGLTINAGGMLDVNNGSGSVVLSGDATHYISKSGSDVGRLYLRNSGSTLSITTNSSTISYSGSPGEIVGENNGALITVAASKTLTSAVDIVGAMQIQASSATFHNNGLVHANRASGTIKVASGSITDSANTSDCSGVRWRVSGDSTVVLWFDVEATGLMGNFSIEDGATLDVDQDVTTTGGVTMECNSSIDVDTDMEFGFDTFCSGATCNGDDPTSPISSPGYTCQCN